MSRMLAETELKATQVALKARPLRGCCPWPLPRLPLQSISSRPLLCARLERPHPRRQSASPIGRAASANEPAPPSQRRPRPRQPWSVLARPPPPRLRKVRPHLVSGLRRRRRRAAVAAGGASQARRGGRNLWQSSSRSGRRRWPPRRTGFRQKRVERRLRVLLMRRTKREQETKLWCERASARRA